MLSIARSCEQRIVLHFDYDCFYAAVFERENPRLRCLPLAVQQKQIVVTCNYEARRRGLYKLQLIREAREQCPDLVIVLGEDLSPFRDASKELYQFLKTFSWSGKVERLGFDEVFMDVTDLIEYNLALLNRYDLSRCFFHLNRNDPTLGFKFDASCPVGNTFPATPPCRFPPVDACEASSEHSQSPDIGLSLILGSFLARHLRHQLEEQKGFTASAGISVNKLLSKLVGNLHKPNDQTTLLSAAPYHVPELESNTSIFMDSHEIGKIPGIGFKISRKIREYILGRLTIQRAGLILNASNETIFVKNVRLSPGMGPTLLEKLLGGSGIQRNIGSKIWNLMHGIDDSAVSRTKDFPRQISIENSYLRLNNMKQVEKTLLNLMQSLLKRMRIDLISATKGAEHDSVSIHGAADLNQWVARPRSLRLTTRPRPPVNPDGSRCRSFSRISKSCDMPSIAFSNLTSIEEIAKTIVHDALVPLFRKLHPETSDWDLSLINLCAANISHHASDDRDGAGRDISYMFTKQVEILKGWNVEHNQLTHIPNIQRSTDKHYNPLGLMTYENVLEEAVPGERKDHCISDRGKRVDENAFNQKEEVAGLNNVCEICGAQMPFFAILAHERYHSMLD